MCLQLQLLQYCSTSSTSCHLCSKIPQATKVDLTELGHAGENGINVWPVLVLVGTWSIVNLESTLSSSAPVSLYHANFIPVTKLALSLSLSFLSKQLSDVLIQLFQPLGRDAPRTRACASRARVRRPMQVRRPARVRRVSRHGCDVLGDLEETNGMVSFDQRRG